MVFSCRADHGPMTGDVRINVNCSETCINVSDIFAIKYQASLRRTTQSSPMDRQTVTACRKSSFSVSAMDTPGTNQETNFPSDMYERRTKRSRRTATPCVSEPIYGEASFDLAAASISEPANWCKYERQVLPCYDDENIEGDWTLQQSNHFCHLVLLEDRGCESWRDFL